MTNRPAQEGRHVLIVAPYGRDAHSVAALLAGHGLETQVYADLTALAAELGDRTGVVLLTEEALKGVTGAVAAALRDTPPWSDIPFVILTAPSRGAVRRSDILRRALPPEITNLVIIERPVGSESLVSAITSALQGRRRQFDMRDRLAELADSEGQLRLATDAANIGIWDFDPVSGRLRWDRRCREMFGLGPEDEITFEGAFVAGLHPDDRDEAVAAVNGALDPTGTGAFDIEYRTVGLNDGVERYIAAKGGAIFEEGRAVRFIGTVVDVSDRKAADEALAASEQALREANRTLEARVTERTAELQTEMANRAAMEAALHQSQKMEAVGQLTGGIAHDFNNMLTGIIGSLDVVRRRIGRGQTDDIDRFLDAATSSALRAAALTERLLAFSRRQSLDSHPVDVNALLAGLEELLRRSINESILLKLDLDAAIPPGRTDPNQLESAILNLAINARDAMPDGGRLTIATRTLTVGPQDSDEELKPGPYVVVSVSDTGVGMDPEMQKKVFEPFFTTKPIGQGTGLGLSMVYGFARQNGGVARLESQPGRGTSVEIYLPVTDAAPAALELVHAPVGHGAGETVLLVEDDESVRLLVAEVLRELGYNGIVAAEPQEAIAVLRGSRDLALMISDVGLPGMNGRQLAEVAREGRPDLPILFITGYAENAAIRADFLGANMAMITKPFPLDTLGAKITEMLSR